jgi:hypothetical protein
VPQQRLVRDHDGGLAIVVEFGDEQPRIDKGVDEVTRRRRVEIFPPGAPPADCFLAFATDMDQRVEHPRQRRLDFARQLFEHGFRPPRQRALDPAEFLVGLERQRAVRAPPLVEFLERELQQGQQFGPRSSGVTEHVVEPLVGREVLLEAQAGGARRQAHHLADLGRGRAASGRTAPRLP